MYASIPIVKRDSQDSTIASESLVRSFAITLASCIPTRVLCCGPTATSDALSPRFNSYVWSYALVPFIGSVNPRHV
ncbi:hypothetical protein SCLCIDRAFT_1208438 [Scleroderma citrinum Foug A]|uniref:Uncharacterized protein n=1 Tax=Scleroderma citrinum Foug A TaxID=1036808 RepID=A0A0C3AVP4_9AGAM|nr:hypothetical protein SCLCIDRAFT_1208438 [Scleroderma citrinum Foug A]